MRLGFIGLGLVLLAVLRAGDVAAQEATRPDDNRFTPVVLVDHGILDEPMVFEVLPDGTVYIAERKGVLRMYDPGTGLTVVVDSIPVNTKYVSAAGVSREAEEGLVGFTLDPNFAENNFAYFLYAHPTVAKHVLSRMVLRGSTLDRDSEVVLLEYDVQRETCCHTGGGMTWDADGNLYITVGNNTGNSNTVQTDQRAGRMNWDDQRGSANTNDLRGKILRIKPQPDGTYTIPEGNLFPPGTPGTRPEIFAMGLRNAWRVSVDSRTGYVYWGEVGPDASQATERTVEGYDEYNQARGPGYFGWPYFIGPNRAYPMIDYATDEVMSPQDPARPINDSRWNTGLRELPPAQPAFIAYPYALAPEYPELGTGGRCAVGGPVYRQADFANAARPWPEYFEGTWIVADCTRNHIILIHMDENSDVVSLEQFLPEYIPVEPIDLKFGPDGDLYVLEYGSVWFAKSPDSRLVRIEYNGGNRAPEVVASVDTKGGTVPFSVQLSAEGTTDPDGDAVTYQWSVTPEAGGAARTFSGANANVSFDQAGVYIATVTATDAAGASSSESIRIVAGNAPPQVSIDVTGNKSFFFAEQAIAYAVHVSDVEDGTVAQNRLAVTIDYVPEGFDFSALVQGDRPVDETTQFAVAQAIMRTTDCNACHQPALQSVGPSFQQLAGRYTPDAATLATLAAKVRAGGSGVWGEVTMPAHPALSPAEAAALVRYMLQSGAGEDTNAPLSGSYVPEVPEGDNGRGAVVIRAVYTDGGAGGLPAQTSESMVVLRSPVLQAGLADEQSNVSARFSRGSGLTGIAAYHGGHVGFHDIDLTGVQRLDVAAQVTEREGQPGGTIEVRLGSPTGQVLSTLQVTGTGGTMPVDVAALSGPQTLYFVFSNDAASPQQPLMTVSTIQLIPE
ncbi:MAG TPA: PQQ-dependent sugar dehydrogenase [Longimicrobiales bacterium]|nr:PQQ-dependent sugar dehydrogenase [Longimicrobiales bacterium]